jgi:hypothetical protein
MLSYQITSDAGVDLGIYEGDTPDEALDAMARDAGYASQADAPSPFSGTVTEVARYIHRDRRKGAVSARTRREKD